MKKVCFLVESPMQLINAIEASHYFKPKEQKLFIRYNNREINDRQIDLLLKYNNIPIAARTTIRERCVYDILKFYFFVIKVLISNPDVLFVGNYKSKIFKSVYRFFNKKNVFFLDDGAQSTYIYYNDVNANMFSYFLFKSNPNPKRLYIHHQFDYFKRLLNANTKQIENCVYFIGAPLVEKGLMSLEVFNNLFSIIYKEYKSKGIDMVYYPHRAEKVDKLKKYQDITIALTELPIEIKLMESPLIPQYVCSFYSAALYTIASLYGDVIKVSAYQFDVTLLSISDSLKEKVTDIYSLYSDIMNVRNI